MTQDIVKTIAILMARDEALMRGLPRDMIDNGTLDYTAYALMDKACKAVKGHQG